MKLLEFILFYIAAASFHLFASGKLFALGIDVSIIQVCAFGAGVFLSAPSALVFAFLCGLFLDFLGAPLFGGYAFSLTQAVCLIIIIRHKMDLSKPLAQMIIAYISTILVLVLYFFAGFVFQNELLYPPWKRVLLLPVLNALVAPFIFAGISKVFEKGANAR